MPSLTATTALVVAAGRGERFGAETPKQYAPLGGTAVLRHAIEAFQGHPMVDRVQCVIHGDDDALYRAAVDGLDLPAPLLGGATRQESVRLGLEGLAALDAPPARVLIHDGARPFPARQLLTDVVTGLEKASGAIPALAVHDTLKRMDGDLVRETVSRAGLFRVQTPQGFRFDDIVKAHQQFKGDELTDDAALLEKAGLEVIAVEGAESNFKITSSDDLVRAERQLSGGSVSRTGFGFDVHRFGDEASESVRLLGIDVPHNRSLAGHSDADVGLHALTDALLGAVGDGDIGEHFPPTDARWRGTDSATFVTHALERVQAHGGAIEHVDITVVCERPKIAPHRDAMRQSVGALLGLEGNRVSVKATTTEGLGPEGRGEGISATAVVTVRMGG